MTDSATAVMPHSRVGIISFAISVISLLCIFAAFVLAGIKIASVGEGGYENSPMMSVCGLLLFSSMLAALVGGVFAIVALLSHDRAKLYAQIGLGINLVIVTATVAMFTVGFLMK